MCKVVNFNEYRGNGNTERDGVKRTSKNNRKTVADRLSTDALIEEFKQNGRSIYKLVLYLIEQYKYIPGYMDNMVFGEVKRDMKYSEICPEVTNKRLRAPLGVKIRGEWHAIEVITDHSAVSAIKRKWETIGNCNVKGFCLEKLNFTYPYMKRMLIWKDEDYYEKLKDIVEAVHKDYFFKNFIYSYECSPFIQINGEGKSMQYIYEMMELSLPYYAILQGTQTETGDKHLLLLYMGDKKEKYAEYYRQKYADADIPLLYARNVETTWKSSAKAIQSVYTNSRSC